MMRFSIKWASVGSTYAGMVFGVIMLTRTAGLGLFTIAMGMFMGGWIGIPLTFAQFLAALLTRALLIQSSLTAQLTMQVTVSAAFYWAIISFLHRWLRGMGGLLEGDSAVLGQIIFFAAGTVCSLICMAIWGNRIKLAEQRN